MSGLLLDKGLKPWEIEKLDEYWLMCYMQPRDKYGNIKVKPKKREPGQPSPLTREGYIAARRLLGWPEWFIKAELARHDENAKKRKEASKARAKTLRETVKRGHKQKSIHRS